MKRTRIIAAVSTALSIGGPAMAAIPREVERSVKFKIVYVAPDGTKTRSGWSECGSPIPSIHPPRIGELEVKIRPCVLRSGCGPVREISAAPDSTTPVT